MKEFMVEKPTFLELSWVRLRPYRWYNEFCVKIYTCRVVLPYSELLHNHRYTTSLSELRQNSMDQIFRQSMGFVNSQKKILCDKMASLRNNNPN